MIDSLSEVSDYLESLVYMKKQQFLVDYQEYYMKNQGCLGAQAYGVKGEQTTYYWLLRILENNAIEKCVRKNQS